jgi:hypothetical protein
MIVFIFKATICILVLLLGLRPLRSKFSVFVLVRKECSVYVRR